MDKVVHSLREAIELAGVKSGMTVSFHHHMRNGDFVLNMVMEELAQMGVKNLTVNASSVFDCHVSQFPAGSGDRRAVSLYLRLRAHDFGIRRLRCTAEGFRVLGATHMHCLPEAGK